jgi:glycosyltransferase involved in cell wall biosynthesis
MIFSVILTYNRPALLKEALSSVTKQTKPADHIIVVDNGSDIPAENVLSDEISDLDISFIRLPKNVGSHKGFEAGFDFFKSRSEPGDWLWVLDDDAHPVPEALETLYNYTDISSVITPNKLSKDGTLFPLLHTYSADDGTRKYFSKFKEDGWSSTNIVSFEGLLISNETLCRIPSLEYNLFICDDDTLLGQLASIIENPIIINKPLLHRKLEDNGLAKWKIPYAIRNKIILRRVLIGVKYKYSLRSSVIFSLNIFIDSVYYISCDIRNIRGVAIGLWNGLKFNDKLDVSMMPKGPES